MKTAPQIDSAILDYLATANGHWRKVAMVVAQVAKMVSPESPMDDAGYETIAKRIAALVESGRISSQGNLTNWRYSEVRIP